MKKLLTMLRVLGMLAVLFGAGLAMTGCEQDNNMEDAAEEVEETTEDAADEVEDATEKTGDEIEDAVD